MGRRPRDEDPREILLDTATRLFCRDGVNCTGLNRLLAEAGVARKTLYEQFGSKQNLLKEVLERDGHRWMEWFESRLDALPGTGADRVAGVFDILEDWFLNEEFYGCPFVNTVAEHDKRADEYRRMALNHRDSIRRAIIRLLRDEGFPRPEELGEQLTILVDGATVTAMVTRTASAARETRAIAEVLLRSQQPVRQTCGAEHHGTA